MREAIFGIFAWGRADCAIHSGRYSSLITANAKVIFQSDWKQEIKKRCGCIFFLISLLNIGKNWLDRFAYFMESWRNLINQNLNNLGVLLEKTCNRYVLMIFQFFLLWSSWMEIELNLSKSFCAWLAFKHWRIQGKKTLPSIRVQNKISENLATFYWNCA